MFQVKLNSRLVLSSPGTIEFLYSNAQDLTSEIHGAALYINNEHLSVSILYSKFQKCKCTAPDTIFGGPVCVQNALLINMSYSCFSYNFGMGSPDIVVWGGPPNTIVSASINQSSFCRSSTLSTSESCSNWFRADDLSLKSLNTSSMSVTYRSSGICFGSAHGTNVPLTSYILIDNCTTANFVIEIFTALMTVDLTQILDHFVITNCEAANAVFGNKVGCKYSISFSNSVLSKIKCNKWVDNDLSLSFDSTAVSDCPSTNAVVDSGKVWDYVWPNIANCKDEKEKSCARTNSIIRAYLALFLFIVKL